jgi:hypothetical protein
MAVAKASAGRRLPTIFPIFSSTLTTAFTERLSHEDDAAAILGQPHGLADAFHDFPCDCIGAAGTLFEDIVDVMLVG